MGSYNHPFSLNKKTYGQTQLFLQTGRDQLIGGPYEQDRTNQAGRPAHHRP